MADAQVEGIGSDRRIGGDNYITPTWALIILRPAIVMGVSPVKRPGHCVRCAYGSAPQPPIPPTLIDDQDRLISLH
jgi:hypothetical protein